MKKNFIGSKSIVLAIVLLFGVSVISGIAKDNSNFNDGNYSIQLTFDSFDLIFGTKIINGYEFATINLIDEGYTTTVGQAKLPILREMVEIPQGSEPTIHIISESWQSSTLHDLNIPDQIIPVQLSLLKDKGPKNSADLIIDDTYYSTNSFLPIKTVNIIETGEIRERRYALIEISPVKYNPNSGELKILNSCVIEIQIENYNLDLTYQNILRYHSPTFEESLEKTFINYGEFEENLKLSSKAVEGLLFIVDDSFISDIQPLVDSKEDRGFDVTVTQKSDIPGGATLANIELYIQDAYDNWPLPPTYIILVGDTGQIPTKTSGLEWGVDCSDLYYVTVSGSDIIPDIYLGRLSASTTDHINSIVDKTVFYEEGDFPNEDWIKKAAFIASSDHSQLAEQTHNYVIDNYLTPNGYVCDKIYEASGGSTSDIVNALNEGRSLCIYSGHGYSGGWACVPFDQSDVNALTNYQMYPLVVSHACSTAPFDNSECYGETWLRAEDKGGIAHWGAAAGTLWDEDDILEKGMFHSWWANGLTTIGGMTDGGLIYLYDYYGGGGSCQYYFEAYNVLGDPSLVVAGSNGSGGVNTPPIKPETPTGPNEGSIGIEYNFSTTTTDSENDELYYMWNWGNEISEWYGPYNSGDVVEISHTWNHPGEYNVKVKAKDQYGYESPWSDSVLVNIIAMPVLEIGEITGGLGLTVEIKNIGVVEALDVEWKIQLDGLVLLGKEKTGTFEKIMPGFSPKAQTGIVIGLGPVDVTITADDAQKTVKATLLGPFVLNLN